MGFATDYFGIFDSQGWSPQADTETADADMVYMTFTPPEGTVFTLDFDTYIEPGSQRGESGAVRVFDAAGRPAVDLSFTTWLVP
ncbi:hypothetical protein HCA44_19930 [Rhodococcus sp. HNM0569]|nr:hypothetical protein [Rhodococcus sp. HNM0569]